MNLPRNHHYSPKFILKRWTVNDGPLCEMRLVRGKVLANHRYPSATGFQKDLYRTDGVPEANTQDVELHFMSWTTTRRSALISFLADSLSMPEIA